MEQQQPSEPPPIKRRRIGYACESCRAKKARCDGSRPSCGPCQLRQLDCVYGPQRTRVSVPQQYVDNLRARNRALEARLASQESHDAQSPSGETPSTERPPYGALQPTMVEPHDPSDPILRDSSQHHQASQSEGLMGRDQIGTQERSSTFHSPRQNDQWKQPLREPFPSIPGQSRQTEPVTRHGHIDANDSGSPAEYFGEASTFSFMAKVSSPDETKTSGAAPATHSAAAATSSSDNAQNMRQGAGRDTTTKISNAHLHREWHPEWLAASSPSTVVFEELLGIGGGVSNPFELPQRQLADKLVAAYFASRHPLSPYLHEGTFRQRYERLWLSHEAGGEEATSSNVVWMGLVNLVFAFGSEHGKVRGQMSNATPSSSTFSSAFPQKAFDRDHARFFRRAKTLVLSGILQTGKIELVQALLLLGHYFHGSLELNHCWTVVGLAIRTAQELGLYLDPAQFTTNIVEQEVHKRVWWGCFAMDRLISTKVGRPPMILDGAHIRADLPLPVDDEFLNEQAGFRQPEGSPSKLEFFRYIVGHCRLVERVLNMMFKGTGGSITPRQATTAQGTESRPVIKMDLPDLLSKSIELDGDLLNWQAALPPHLRPDSQAPAWHFQRQKSVLLMRFLHTRLLIHRQALLFYIFRPITDSFQLEIIFNCIKRCVMAASESISQMRLLRQHNSLSSSWHNSHYIFSALGVLLVFQRIEPRFRADVGIPSSLDLDEVIDQGLENLERVGDEIHPLASRYAQSFEQLRTRLQDITIGNSKLQKSSGSNLTGVLPGSSNGQVAQEHSGGHKGSPVAGAARRGLVTAESLLRNNDTPRDTPRYSGDASFEHEDGNNFAAEGGGFSLPVPGLDDDFAILQSVLVDGDEWPGLVDYEWQT